MKQKAKIILQQSELMEIHKRGYMRISKKKKSGNIHTIIIM